MNRRRSAPESAPRRRRRCLGLTRLAAGKRARPVEPGNVWLATESGRNGDFATDHRLTAAAVLSVAGLAVSLYMTATRFDPGEIELYCSTLGPINCQQVTASPQSMIGWAPVSVLGAAWFVAMLVLVGLSLYRYAELVTKLRLIWTAAGVAFVGYLIYAEAFLIGALCEWCTTVHVVVIALFGLCLWEVIDARSSRMPSDVAKSRN